MANVELNIGVNLSNLSLNSLLQSHGVLEDQSSDLAICYDFPELFNQFENAGSVLGFLTLEWLRSPSVRNIIALPGELNDEYRILMLLNDSLQPNENAQENRPITSIVVCSSDLDGLVAITDLDDISSIDLISAMRTRSTIDDRAVITNAFAGNDIFNLGDDRDVVNGLGGIDTIYGNGGNDVLSGGKGKDMLDGGDGRDRLFGGTKADRLFGGDGNDYLNGGKGRDRMTGGDGADIFDFNTINETRATRPDVITDFEQGVDRIDLRSIDASVLVDGHNSFEFIGWQSFGESRNGAVRAMQVQIDGEASYTLIMIDNDNDVEAEAAIRLMGSYTLTADDFIF